MEKADRDFLKNLVQQCDENLAARERADRARGFLYSEAEYVAQAQNLMDSHARRKLPRDADGSPRKLPHVYGFEYLASMIRWREKQILLLEENSPTYPLIQLKVLHSAVAQNFWNASADEKHALVAPESAHEPISCADVPQVSKDRTMILNLIDFLSVYASKN